MSKEKLDDHKKQVDAARAAFKAIWDRVKASTPATTPLNELRAWQGFLRRKGLAE